MSHKSPSQPTVTRNIARREADTPKSDRVHAIGVGRHHSNGSPPVGWAALDSRTSRCAAGTFTFRTAISRKRSCEAGVVQDGRAETFVHVVVMFDRNSMPEPRREFEQQHANSPRGTSGVFGMPEPRREFEQQHANSPRGTSGVFA